MSRKKNKTPSPPKQPTPAPAVAPLSKSRRRIFTTVALLLPIVLLILLEIALRAAGYGDQLRLAHRVAEEGRVWWEINRDVGRRYFGLQPEFARQAEEGRLAFVKPTNGFRVICLGESSMAGFPYNKNAAMPGILRTYLQQLFPDREIEVVNLGIAATNSFAVRDLMRDVLALAPDVILIYAGHNEFYGALGAASTFSLGGNRTLVNLYLRLLRYRTFYLLQQAVRQLAGLFQDRPNSVTKSVMQTMARQQTIPYGSTVFETTCAAFAKNLDETLALAHTSRVPVLVGNLVSNLKDQPPFVSASSFNLRAEQEKDWRDIFTAGEQLLQARQPQLALENFLSAAQIDSSPALLSFNLAKCFLSAGDTGKAAPLFSRARDLDLLRFRAPDTFNVIIENVCKKNTAPMIDLEHAFRARSRGGIIGNELIAEHLHPIVHGYALMAKTFLHGLQSVNMLPAFVDSARLANLPENLAALNITVLDEEIGRLRILSLTSEWPFKQAINLPILMDAQITPLVQEIATRYLNREISWGQAHVALAEQLTKMKKYEAALAEYRTLAQEYPDEHAVFENIGETLISLQRYAEALPAFSRALELNPNSPLARAGAGKAFMFLAKYPEAEAAFSAALKLDDAARQFSPAQRSFIFYLWGGALTNLHRYPEAETKFIEALRIDPRNVLAQNFLSTLRAKTHKGQ
ncbi:MAG: hypothetical protein ALAOOOJD_00874 [bacterium]|nr:hypothetical protein [bacterium]